MSDYTIKDDLVIFPENITSISTQLVIEIAQKIQDEMRNRRTTRLYESLDRELTIYGNETKDERMTRATNNDNWIFEKCEENRIIKDDIQCSNDECYFNYKPHLVYAYTGSYRLMGTEGVYLCDVCINDYRDSDDVNRAIGNEY